MDLPDSPPPISTMSTDATTASYSSSVPKSCRKRGIISSLATEGAACPSVLCSGPDMRDKSASRLPCRQCRFQRAKQRTSVYLNGLNGPEITIEKKQTSGSHGLASLFVQRDSTTFNEIQRETRNATSASWSTASTNALIFAWLPLNQATISSATRSATSFLSSGPEPHNASCTPFRTRPASRNWACPAPSITSSQLPAAPASKNFA
mmetsp:Transcript_14421/g.41182  ORF Transcript_14421/g.41182 Transcript_14421/m.41182 type:complete len:207 (-) Transcript_14421:636-1256(-)